MTVKFVVVCEACGFEARAAHWGRDPLMKAGLGSAFNAIPNGWFIALQIADDLTSETAEQHDNPPTLCSWQCLSVFATGQANRFRSWAKGQLPEGALHG